MSSDSDWIQEVRRWYLQQSVSAMPEVHGGEQGQSAQDAASDIGYEAADPVLQNPHGFDVRAMAGRRAHLR